MPINHPPKTKAALSVQLIHFLERQPGWRLWLGFSLACLVAVEVIVSLMDLLLNGEVSWDYLLTGLVAAGLVAPLSLAGLTHLLETTRQAKADALELQSLRASKNLQVSLDAARMLFWELDLARGALAYDDSRLHWLGLEPAQALHTVDGFMALVHPDDRAKLLNPAQQSFIRPNEPGREYRIRLPDGRWVWHRTVARVAARDAAGQPTLLAGGTVNITGQKQAELALRASEERANRLATMLRLVSDNVPDMIWAKDLNRRYLFANKAICEQLLGASSTDEPLGRDDLFFAQRQRASHPEDANWHTFGEICRDTDGDTLRSGKPMRFDEAGFVGGRFVSLEVHKAPLVDDHGQLMGVVGTARDVTEQKAAQDKLRLASLVLEHSSEALLATDADNRIVEVNPAFTALTGYTRDEVLGRNPSLLSSGRQGPDFYKAMWHDLTTQGHWQGELWNQRKNGEVFAEWLTINTIYHPDGSVHRRVALFSDVTQKKLAEELIWKQANFDALTGLPNRRMFLDRLAQDLLKAQRSGHRLAVFFLDLDHFKEVNDRLGHETGDLLLREAAQRLSACVRASDTVARLGGDEFTVILPDVDAPARVETIAHNIIGALSRPYALNGHLAHITVSIGITFYPQDATDIESLLENADQAMYEAKRNGRNSFDVFTRALQDRAQGHVDLMADLRQAMGNGQLKLYFQPIVSLQSGKLHKVEALLRWYHPQRGMVGPAEFIPLAEECGLIHALGDWVFEQAVAQARRWSGLAGGEVKMALNLSPLQLLRAHVRRLGWGEQLALSGLRGDNFVIEIPENLLHDSSQVVKDQLKVFQDAGTGVSVDHVGAGCTTFMELKKRQVDYFKIERSTIQNLAPGSDELALARAVVVMAHQLSLSVIAEGVETRQQHRLLCELGCDFAQGYFYAKPMAAEGIELLLAQGAQLHLPA